MNINAKKNIKNENKSENNSDVIPNSKRKKKLKYSLLTLLLVVFLAQLIWGVIINSAKFYSLRAKIFTLEKINKVAEQKNRYLREELEKYNSNTGVEALARNRLQFSKEDETLVIIKNSKQEDEQD